MRKRYLFLIRRVLLLAFFVGLTACGRESDQLIINRIEYLLKKHRETEALELAMESYPDAKGEYRAIILKHAVQLVFNNYVNSRRPSEREKTVELIKIIHKEQLTTDGFPFEMLANVYEFEKKWLKAVKSLKQAEKQATTQPDKVRFRMRLIHILRRQQRWKDVIAECDSLLKHHPTAPEIESVKLIRAAGYQALMAASRTTTR